MIMTCRNLLPLLLALSGILPSWALSAEAPKSGATVGGSNAGAAEASAAWPFDAKEAVRRQDEAAKALGVKKETEIDLGGVAMKFVLIPAGKFKDGSGKEVSVARPYYMGVYIVTQAQFEKIMEKNPSKHSGTDNPADNVKWADADEFCMKISEKTKKRIAIPSVAQWEYACRAGTATRCYWGDDMQQLTDYCWCATNSGDTTHPVGQKKPNAFGLYDMMGQVYVWCSDGGAAVGSHPLRGLTYGVKAALFDASLGIRQSDAQITGRLADRVGMRVMMYID